MKRAFTLAEVFSPHCASNGKAAFTLAEVFSPYCASNDKAAFTLAEVLITLGVIGVVAAVTMPVLLEQHQKKVVVTRMQKFYSVFNQALTASTIDNGPLSDWTFPADYYDYTGSKTFFETYLKDYLVYTKTVKNDHTIWPTYGFLVYLNDGSAFNLAGSWITYYPVANKRKVAGKEVFLFVISKTNNSLITYDKNDKLWGCTREKILSSSYLTTECSCQKETANVRKRACAGLIMMDGWQIKDDYPW